MNPALLSSERMDWATPQDFFDIVHAEFGFTLDAAASERNAKCPAYFAVEDDALTQDWSGVVWCNPPYGRTLGRWVEKASREAQERGAVVVMLIPARPDTAYWHDFVMRAAEVRLIRGRLTFGTGEAPAGAPFPSALIVFRPGAAGPPTFSTMLRPKTSTRAPRASTTPSPMDGTPTRTGLAGTTRLPPGRSAPLGEAPARSAPPSLSAAVGFPPRQRGGTT